MKNKVYILLLLLFSFSCLKRENDNELYNLREDSLIYGLLDSLIMPDSIWRKFLLVDSPLFSKNCSKNELKRIHDSLIQKWDTASLYISFEDTLLVFSKVYHSRNVKNTKDYFDNNLTDIDTSYFSLIEKLANDTTIKGRKLDHNGFKTNYRYKIIQKDSTQIIVEQKRKLVEINEFSRIIFNKEYNKACFYYQTICGRLCGGGDLIFVEKKNGYWKIVARKNLWAS